MEINKELFPKRLKEILDNTQWTTRSLAKKTGVSYSAISRYSKGEMTPKIGTAILISNAVGVNLAWLIGISEKKYTDKPSQPILVSPAKQEFINKIMDMDDDEFNRYAQLLELFQQK